MSVPSGLLTFENRRWSRGDQVVVERHRLALQLVRDEPILDIGGGDGLFASLLRQVNGLSSTEIIDLSPVAVQKAVEKGFAARTFDITQTLPFEDGSFGTVCALDVLEHVYDPVELLAEAARVGRSVIISVPNFHYWKDRARALVGSVPFQCRPQRGHVYWFNYAILLQVVASAGLQTDVMLFSSMKRPGRLGPWLARAHPNLFAESFVARLVPAVDGRSVPPDPTSPATQSPPHEAR